MNLKCIVMLAGLSLAAGGATAWAKAVQDTGPAQAGEATGPYAHLRWFGFYASAMGQWNFTQQLAPFTNLTWIHVGAPGDPVYASAQMVDRVREARDAGVSAVLSIEPFLFRDDEGHPRPALEIEEFLVELKARLEDEALLDSVAMIYPADEPFRNFRRARNPDVIEQYVTGEVYADIHADLESANAAVRAVFPDTPLGVILSGYEIYHDFFSIPASYDWVGYDCYQSLFRGCDNRSAVAYYRRLLAHMQPHQRLMAVPETWATPDRAGEDGWPGVLLQRLRQHYEIALAEPRFIAFIPFIWSFDVDGQPSASGIGLDRFPATWDQGADLGGSGFLDAVLDIGWQVRNGQHVYPGMAWSQTEAHPARQPSQVVGDILSLDAHGTLEAWAVDTALPHKNLRFKVEVRDKQARTSWTGARERSFLHGDEAALQALVGQPLVGTHVYRFQVPAGLLRRNRGGPLDLRVSVYADGEDAFPALELRATVHPAAVTWLPMPPPAASTTQRSGDLRGASTTSRRDDGQGLAASRGAGSTARMGGR